MSLLSPNSLLQQRMRDLYRYTMCNRICSKYCQSGFSV